MRMTLSSMEGPKKSHSERVFFTNAGYNCMSVNWLLLIYTVPAEPTRKRATVWREVKKLGALYLRDGVCIVPDRPATLAAVRALATRIEAFDGQSTIITRATLDQSAAASVVDRFQSARSDEYADIAYAAEELLQHVARETEHREFNFNELEELEEDLTKLRRWRDQVRARDYFPTDAHLNADSLLERCAEALNEFMLRAAAEDTSP